MNEQMTAREQLLQAMFKPTDYGTYGDNGEAQIGSDTFKDPDDLYDAMVDSTIAHLWDVWDHSYDFSDAFEEFMTTMDPDPNEIVEFALKHLIGPRESEAE